MNFHIITIFPELIGSYMNESIMKRAIEAEAVSVSVYNPRDYTTDKHKTVDDKAYGGGPGMVLMATPILKAVEAAIEKSKAQMHARTPVSSGGAGTNVKIILLSPSGEQFTNDIAEEYTQLDDVIIIAGHYEGIDARVEDVLRDYVLRSTNYELEKISIGPYTLTGGELPALTIIDAVARRLPGVLGADESIEERRTAARDVYTRPETLEYGGKEYKVPDVLLSGDHKRIEEWRREN